MSLTGLYGRVCWESLPLSRCRMSSINIPVMLKKLVFPHIHNRLTRLSRHTMASHSDHDRICPANAHFDGDSLTELESHKLAPRFRIHNLGLG